MFNICLNALSRFVFLSFAFGYLWFLPGFIERCIYLLYLCVNKYFDMWKVWRTHCPFLICHNFFIFFRIRIPINSQPYVKYSYISEKISKFFVRLVFGNLKITKITKIIIANSCLNCGSLCLVVGCSCSLWLVVSCCASLWHVVDFCSLLWVVVAHCGWLWFGVTHCGSLWVVGVCCGLLWFVVAQCIV